MKHRLSLLLAFLLASAGTICGQQKTPADWVNPFIGASTNVDKAGAYHGLGKTFPGATTPFGMTQVSPQTITGGDNGSGYSYEHETIEGFAMTQMSGVGWYGDLGNFMVMPTTGRMFTVAGLADGTLKGWRSRYDKATETARAGFYSATLTDYDIQAEATAAPHCGMLRFTYPEHACSRIQVDLARRVGGTSTWQAVRLINDHTIEGYMQCTPDGGGWGDGQGKALYTVYFHAEWNKAAATCGFWRADIAADEPRHRDNVTSRAYQERVAQAEVVQGVDEMAGTHIGFFAEFPTTASEAVELKVGISFVDIDGARRNFEAEVAGKSFDQVAQEARDAWNKALSAVAIEGGNDDEKAVFYTALYHTMLDPRTYQDVDGRYVGGDYAPHTTDGTFTKRTIFSGWDVFRSQMPLQTIIHPEVVNDVVASLVEQADRSKKGFFERWEMLNAYSGCMIGNPAIVVLADAWAKGILTTDLSKAYDIARESSKRFGNPAEGFTPGGGGISLTLEYAYNDWCMARLAKAVGRADDVKFFTKKSRSWRTLFDAEQHWFRPRNADGTWMEWPAEGRLREGYGCVESNALQQGWFVPHDIKGMVRTMGGRQQVVADLESMFEHTPEDMMWNAYYNHANEPVHFIPFLFNRLGRPDLTQKWTRFICSHAYKNKVEGLCGNEDVGQMSAWYVLSSIGMHPVCPGDERFELTSPVFERVVIRVPAVADEQLRSGKEDRLDEPGAQREFVITAHNNSNENIYIQKATLNGRPLKRCQLRYRDIMRGGKLDLFMGDKPSRWGR